MSETEAETNKVDLEVEKLKAKISHLCDYVDTIAEKEGFENTRRTINKLKDRQKRRKIQEFKSYVDKALWFAQTFGLEVNLVKFSDVRDTPYTLDNKTVPERKNVIRNFLSL